MTGWPTQVPVLTAEDSYLNDPDGRRIRINTIGYWISRTFAFGSTAYVDAYRALRRGHDDWRTCDGKPSSPQACATIWNRAMARLGYTEGNPETPRSKP